MSNRARFYRAEDHMKLILAVCLVLAFSYPASALETVWNEASAHRIIHHRPKCRRRHHRPAQSRNTVRTVVITTEPIGIGPQCVDQRVDVISTPHQTVEAAKDAAQTQWRAKAQFLAGGIYMDPRWSADQKWLCSITDPRDSASSKVSETTGKLLGNSGELYRCYFSARPCRSNMQFGDE